MCVGYRWLLIPGVVLIVGALSVLVVSRRRALTSAAVLPGVVGAAFVCGLFALWWSGTHASDGPNCFRSFEHLVSSTFDSWPYVVLTGAVIATLLIGIDRIAARGSSDRHTVLGLAGGALAMTVIIGFLDSSLSWSYLN